jgi:hypothetical protein
MALGYVETLRHSRLAAITSAVGSNGKLRIYKGTRPATGGAETDLLVELACSATFAPAPSGGQLTANAITDGTAGDSGTATWFRVLTSGNVAVLDGSVSATGGGGDMELSSTSIVAGGTVSISSFVITAGNA